MIFSEKELSDSAEKMNGEREKEKQSVLRGRHAHHENEEKVAWELAFHDLGKVLSSELHASEAAQNSANANARWKKP